MKLFENLKKCKGNRSKYRIKPVFKFEVDTDYYYFSFLPTVLWMPWIYRSPNTIGVVDIWWLNFHIYFGKWESLSCKDCKHHYDCIDSGKRTSYWDDVFENGEKCSDYKSR